MTDSTSDVADLRVADLLTFLSVVRSSSLTAAARERQVTPSQVSKALTRLETHFGRRLVDRGSRGIVLSEAGRQLAPSLEHIVAQLESVRAAKGDTTDLALGAPSYLQAALLPAVAAAAPNVRVSAFELPPSLLRASAQDEQFELLLLPGRAEHLPPGWLAESIGEMRKGLFGAPAFVRRAFGRRPVAPEELLEIPFVCPIFRQQGRGIPMDDDCPLPRHQRTVGHEVQTIFVGLEIAAATDQLVFGPVLAAERHLRAGALVEVEVEGWNIREPLCVATNVDRVAVNLRTAIVRSLRSALGSPVDDP